jgi:hypothetical protein
MLLAALLAGLVLAVSGTVATPALAAGNPVVQDCFDHGKLTQTYTKAELNRALTVMSSYVKEYSDCQSVIETALASGKLKPNGGGTGKGGGGSSISTPVIIVIVVVVLAILAFGALLIRRRRRLTGGGSAGDQPTQVMEPETRVMDDGDDHQDDGPAP